MPQHDIRARLDGPAAERGDELRRLLPIAPEHLVGVEAHNDPIGLPPRVPDPGEVPRQIPRVGLAPQPFRRSLAKPAIEKGRDPRGIRPLEAQPNAQVADRA